MPQIGPARHQTETGLKRGRPDVLTRFSTSLRSARGVGLDGGAMKRHGVKKEMAA